MSLKSFLYDEMGTYLRVRNAIIIQYGCASAIWLAQLLYHLKGLLDKGVIGDDDWFYCQQDWIKKMTGISIDTQTRIIKKFVDDGILEVRRHIDGTFVHRNLYKINEKDYHDMVHRGEDQIRIDNDKQKEISIPKNTNIETRKQRVSESDISGHEIKINKNQDKINSPSFPSEKKSELIRKPDGFLSEGILFKPYSIKARQVCEYWNENFSPRLRIAKTKMFDATMQKIEIACSKYSLDEIACAFEDYNYILSLKETKLNKSIDTHYVGLSGFFGFTDFQKGKIKSGSLLDGVVSWFDECLNGRDYLIQKYTYGVEDEYPEVSDIMKKQWMKSPFHIGTLTIWDNNNFRTAATKLVKWLEKNENKYNLDSLYIDYPGKAIVKYLFPAIRDALGERDPKIVTTLWLVNFERNLHIYLKKLGL